MLTDTRDISAIMKVMDKDLLEVIKVYATKPHTELSALLLQKSKDQLIALFNDLLTGYINDKNSSSIREIIVTSIAGYTHNTTKIGYNGYKQATIIGAKPISCEVKPKNVSTEDNKEKKLKRKHDGGGNFTDYTHKRLARDLRERPNMLVAGFVDGELIFILEFPFKCKSFVEHLKQQLDRHFPNGDELGRFLRSAVFSFEDYRNCKSLKLVYKNRGSLEKHKATFTKNFFDFLRKLPTKKSK